MKNKLKLPFDRIYLLNLAERKDRLDSMYKKFEYLGISDKVEIHTAVKHPWSDVIADAFRNAGMFLSCGGAYNCTIEHYTMIKTAYLQGCETIMIIEDDCSFIKDIDKLNKYFSNLPADWDILRICPLRGQNEEDILSQKYGLWIPVFSGMWGTGCYALNRKGMEYMMNCINSRMQPIDMPLYMYDQNTEIHHYLPKEPVSLILTEDSDIAQCNVGLQSRNIKNLNITEYI